MDTPAHDFSVLRQAREIDMGGEVDFARPPQRVAVGMSGDRLQGFAETLADMAIVDDQRHAIGAGTPPELERDVIGPPFIDRAFRRLPQFPRQGRFEMRQGVGRDADPELAVGRDLDHPLVPAAGLFDGLMHRQRVDEFVGDDDGGTSGHVGQRSDATETGSPRISSFCCCNACSFGLISTRCSTMAV